MNKNDIIVLAITISWMFTVLSAINDISLLNTILLAFNATATGIYFGICILEAIVRRKGIMKLDGKLYELRLKQ